MAQPTMTDERAGGALQPAAASTNAHVRQRNLSTVLGILHHDGPHSRAELVRRTGLTRSTMTVLTAELMEMGLIRDGPARGGSGRVGRPGVLVEANPEVAAVAVHPESDAITVAVVGLGGGVLRRVRYDTPAPASARETVRVVRSIVDGMSADLERDHRIVGVGVAVPGLVRSRTGRVLLAPHLGWRDESIAEALSKSLGRYVIAANDASVGARGESVFGAGRGVRNIVFANGTSAGIGGGVIIGGEVLNGTEGFAGELGHTVVDRNGARCHCGRRGCLEAEVSLQRLLPHLARTHIDEDELDIALGLSRDPALLAEVSRQAELLSEALTDFVNLFSPDMVVLSGYLGNLLSVSRERLTDAVRVHPVGGETRSVRLERSKLRSSLMLVGAAELVFADRVLPVTG
ncbi:ROK family transcriptional regulator [Microbacterium betulae]|uniref:ROK family transcriptional regulator n=1 Tax=Microbacterium betulae TaxID=2981139 RepID=A0AA97FH86_9MICO|nr:ROK family transcriptional regulator [Microbacterium sp. AB]WOF22044.1 ROK family transcriptional regulator [Microbacterium sp. AB]